MKHKIIRIVSDKMAHLSDARTDNVTNALNDLFLEELDRERALLFTVFLGEESTANPGERIVADAIKGYKNTPPSTKKLIRKLFKAIIDSGIKFEIDC